MERTSPGSSGPSGRALARMRYDVPSGSSRTVWLGHEFADLDTQRHVKRVVISTAVMAVITTGIQVVALCSHLARRHLGPNAVGTASVHLATGLMLPACGFFGATRSSSSMMCCFCGFNLFFALLYGAALLLFMAALWQTDASIQATCDASCKVLGCGFASKACSCELDCQRRAGALCCSDFAEVCPLTSAGPRRHMSCQDLAATLTTANVIVVAVLLLAITPGIALSAYAWYHGMMLWRRLAAGDQLVAGGGVALSHSPRPSISRAEDEEAEGGTAALAAVE
eukprot:CAMPEP_0204602150 /NCGR_PEP_ID=MMETSP0661-20131031/56477_1 /ASSEMBLY_ACC=CAM_ASM_000606 /TAXON_ID=109239 /ORGANISM="Alexandrium margalefi, Strain AMGDE01CS-322" /LENGTH=282 /DNA_ID=CAMNT_0051613085 /DNA_START=9 /DNA_END=857 /DNA_ORIENTATION=+